MELISSDTQDIEFMRLAIAEARKHEWWTRVTSFSPLGAAIVEAL